MLCVRRRHDDVVHGRNRTNAASRLGVFWIATGTFLRSPWTQFCFRAPVL